MDTSAGRVPFFGYPSCEEVVLRVVETTEATYVDVRGAAYLRFERTPS